MQELDNNNRVDDREDFKRRISMPMSSPNPYANNIEEEINTRDWSHTTTFGGGGGEYQVPTE